MSTMIDKLFPTIMFFEAVFLAFVIFSTLYFYLNYIRPKHIFGVPVYVLIIIVFVSIGLLLGWDLGIKLTCSSSVYDNHCDVWGFLITGPISASLAILFAEFALYVGGNVFYVIKQKKHWG
jgi:hypothetical protein